MIITKMFLFCQDFTFKFFIPYIMKYRCHYFMNTLLIFSENAQEVIKPESTQLHEYLEKAEDLFSKGKLLRLIRIVIEHMKI